MKNNINLFKIAVLSILAFVTFSCNYKNDEPLVPANNNLVGIIERNADLSLFNEAITIAGLKNVPTVAPAVTVPPTEPIYLSNGTVTYTVFAPNNNAMTMFLSANGFANLAAVPVATLRQYLLNHITAGQTITSSSSGYTKYVKTFAFGPMSSGYNKLSLYIDNKVYTALNATPVAGEFVKLNGVSTITTPDIAATNGTLHIIDKVIPLPTVVDHALANKNLTSLVTALTSPGQPAFTTILAGTGPFTVFAPVNTAFTSFATEITPFNPTGTGTISTANLTKVLNYHVANGNLLRTALTNNLVINTLQTPPQQNVTVQVTTAGTPPVSTYRLKDQSITLPLRVSTITTLDVQCTNGVVHLIDKVLLPN